MQGKVTYYDFPKLFAISNCVFFCSATSTPCAINKIAQSMGWTTHLYFRAWYFSSLLCSHWIWSTTRLIEDGHSFLFNAKVQNVWSVNSCPLCCLVWCIIAWITFTRVSAVLICVVFGVRYSVNRRKGICTSQVLEDMATSHPNFYLPNYMLAHPIRQ